MLIKLGMLIKLYDTEKVFIQEIESILIKFKTCFLLYQ